MAQKSTRKKDYPCLRCDKHVKITDYAVQCWMCEHWVHKACENISDDTFKCLDMQARVQERCFWACKSCASFALKFEKRMKDIDKRVQQIEEKLPKVETEIEKVTAEISQLKNDLNKVSTNAGTIQENATTSVFEELKERENRKCNVVIHNLAEPADTIRIGKERNSEDKKKIQELCEKIESALDVTTSVRFAKRLGERKDDNPDPRPLLVGFKEPTDCVKLLDCSPKLADMEDPWLSINIVADLTKIQRADEKRMRELAAKRNEELPEEEKGN